MSSCPAQLQLANRGYFGYDSGAFGRFLIFGEHEQGIEHRSFSASAAMLEAVARGGDECEARQKAPRSADCGGN